ncbi:hypothetical protein [Catellatospora methionotrophica]|nr:hypothetical protein [Catellatospora methionotrophica]
MFRLLFAGGILLLPTGGALAPRRDAGNWVSTVAAAGLQLIALIIPYAW